MRSSYYPHFTDEELDAAQSHRAASVALSSNLVSLFLKYVLLNCPLEAECHLCLLFSIRMLNLYLSR